MGGGRAQDTLSFVDVRFIAYNKNPDDNNRSHAFVVVACVSSQVALCAASQLLVDKAR